MPSLLCPFQAAVLAVIFPCPTQKARAMACHILERPLWCTTSQPPYLKNRGLVVDSTRADGMRATACRLAWARYDDQRSASVSVLYAYLYAL